MIIGIIVIILTLISIGYYFSTLNQSEEYKSILSEIERGNEYTINHNSGDNCFPYRYFNRGCYYAGKLKFYEGLLISDFSNTNLTHEEKIDLCYKFAFKGSTAWCLHKNSEDEKCLSFAGENEYLKRICSLKEGETIPNGGFYDVEYQDDPIPTQSYSDLI